MIPHDGARADKRKAREEAERCCDASTGTAIQTQLNDLIERWSDVAMGSHSMGMVALLEELRGICDG